MRLSGRQRSGAGRDGRLFARRAPVAARPMAHRRRPTRFHQLQERAVVFPSPTPSPAPSESCDRRRPSSPRGVVRRAVDGCVVPTSRPSTVLRAKDGGDAWRQSGDGDSQQSFQRRRFRRAPRNGEFGRASSPHRRRGVHPAGVHAGAARWRPLRRLPRRFPRSSRSTSTLPSSTCISRLIQGRRCFENSLSVGLPPDESPSRRRRRR